MDCIFCKIIANEIPATIIYENSHVIAFDDLNPKAPQHKLIIPRKHIASINELKEEDAALAGQILLAAKILAKNLGIAEPGYRFVINCNEGAGQTVFHLHAHLLGGRPLHWPPG